MLEIAVDRDDGLAGRVREAGRQRDVLAEVAREADDLDPRILRGRRGEHAERAVAAAVVDEDDLERLADALEDRARSPR